MYLEHYGIKGQKKGVRRFQYENMTYTPAGNERYRPKKNTASKIAIAAGGNALLMATLPTTLKYMSAIPITKIASETVALGAAVVSGLATIPLPAVALGVPIGAMATMNIISNIKDNMEEEQDWKDFYSRLNIN